MKAFKDGVQRRLFQDKEIKAHSLGMWSNWVLDKAPNNARKTAPAISSRSDLDRTKGPPIGVYAFVPSHAWALRIYDPGHGSPTAGDASPPIIPSRPYTMIRKAQQADITSPVFSITIKRSHPFAGAESDQDSIHHVLEKVNMTLYGRLIGDKPQFLDLTEPLVLEGGQREVQGAYVPSFARRLVELIDGSIPDASESENIGDVARTIFGNLAVRTPSALEGAKPLYMKVFLDASNPYPITASTEETLI